MNQGTMNSKNPAASSQASAAAPRVLEGVRVLDMSRVLAGPWAAQLLGDFGADVIKLERPGVGDDSRSWEPAFRSDGPDGGRESAYFCSANRGKRSVTLDFTTAEGAQTVQQLVASADVLIENYKVGTLARYVLSYAASAEISTAIDYNFRIYWDFIRIANPREFLDHSFPRQSVESFNVSFLALIQGGIDEYFHIIPLSGN